MQKLEWISMSLSSCKYNSFIKLFIHQFPEKDCWEINEFDFKTFKTSSILMLVLSPLRHQG